MKRKGFTLIEILIVIIITGILATMASAFFSSDYNKQKACAENLEKLHQAIEKYRGATGVYPPDEASGADSLKGALYPAYISDVNVFKCPVDTTDDSYSKFYVRRNDYSNMAAFTLGCYRHEGEKSAMNLFFQGQTMKQKLAPINNGTLAPGTEATGRIVFADNSTANVSGGNVIVLQSFEIGNNKCYSLLRAGEGVSVTTTVTDGSKFEVISPSMIAGVGGTTFIVEVQAGGKTVVEVVSGSVTVSDKEGKGKIEVKEDEVVEVEIGQPPTRKDGVSKPKAVITVSSTVVSSGVSITFDGSGSTCATERSIVSYLWDFDDDNGAANTSTGPTATHTYINTTNKTKTYHVSLKVTDSTGKHDTAIVKISVSAPPND